MYDGHGVLKTHYCFTFVKNVFGSIDYCIFQVDKAFTATVENKITPLTLAVYLKYSCGNVFI